MKTIPLRWLSAAAAHIITTTLVIAEPAAYDVHEWGTFTSLQTSNGECLSWAGVPTLDLPSFVWSTTRPGAFQPLSIRGKSRMSETQRMETPVLYFYPNQPMRATVRVDFPKGFITEWYPQATSLGPIMRVPNATSDRSSYIEWTNIELLATNSTSDPSLLAVEDGPNHYYAARNTNASLLSLANAQLAEAEHEKFLFYRGLGKFDPPLVVRATGQGNLTLENGLHLPLVHLFALEVEDGLASFHRADHLSPGQKLILNASNGSPKRPMGEVIAELRLLLTTALASEGLYPAEAAAMVATWQDTWFTEQGTRVLYILPREWTDETLPIRLSPEPRSLVRVMVGRVDAITPEMERKIHDGLLGQNPSREEVDLLRSQMGRFEIPMSYHALRNETSAARELAIRRLAGIGNR